MGGAVFPIIVGVASSLAGGVVSSLFAPDAPEPTAPAPPPDIPKPDNSAAQRAAEEKRKRASQSGRASTVLVHKGLMDEDNTSASKLLQG